MALTRKLLKSMGLSDEQVETVIEAHTDTVDGLKNELSGLKDKAKELETVRNELDSLKSADNFKDKYDKEHSEFEKYKADIAAEKAHAEKARAFREALEKAKINKTHIDMICDTRTAEKLIEEIEIKDGKNANADKLADSIIKNWGGYVEKDGTQNANVEKPPQNTGGNLITKEKIMQIKDGSERRRAIAENLELFSNSAATD